MKMLFPIFLSTCALYACSNEASHLPSPISLPGAAIGSVFENATYGARRDKVKAYVSANYQVLRSEVEMGQGVHLNQVMDITGISGEKRAKVVQELRGDNPVYFPEVATDGVVEAVVVALMVHS